MENVSCFGRYEVNIWLKRHIWLWYSSTICSTSIIIIKLFALNCVNPQSTCINLDWYVCYGHINYNSVETKNVFIHEFYRCNFLIISFFSFFALLFIFFFLIVANIFLFFAIYILYRRYQVNRLISYQLIHSVNVGRSILLVAMFARYSQCPLKWRRNKKNQTKPNFKSLWCCDVMWKCNNPWRRIGKLKNEVDWWD